MIMFFFFKMFCSNPGHPFCSGVTLAKLAAVTMDEHGNETFDTSGVLDKLRKVSSISDLSNTLAFIMKLQLSIYINLSMQNIRTCIGFSANSLMTHSIDLLTLSIKEMHNSLSKSLFLSTTSSIKEDEADPVAKESVVSFSFGVLFFWMDFSIKLPSTMKKEWALILQLWEVELYPDLKRELM